MSHPATPTARVASLVLVACLLLSLTGCGVGGYHHDDYDHYDGNVFVENRTNTTTPRQALTFRLSAFGEPFTGNLLGAPLDPGATRFVGEFHEDYYDAKADMAVGGLVEWFDRWVGHASDTTFEIY